jgi:hypothetical protein
MPAALNKNNAYSTLAGSLTNSSSSMTVATGHGDRFPIVTGSDWCMVTLQDASNNIEIVKVTARASGADTLSITRAQEGTTARSWSIGDIVELRLTAGTVATVDGTQTLKNKTISGADNTLTNIPGANVTGTVPSAATAGACTGNAATATTADACTGNSATATNATTAATVSTTVASGAVGTTQSPGDNSTKIATTAYTDAAVAAIPAASTSTSGKVELATTAELQAGTDADRAVTAAAIKGALGFSKFFESTDQTITPNSVLPVPHSFSARPKMFTAVLKCATDELGYVAGDEAEIIQTVPGTSVIQLNADATNVNIGYTGSNTQVLRKDTQVAANITAGNWRFVVRAWV